MTHTLHNGAITLHHGDCLDVMKDIPDGSVDAIICDIPYGTTKCAWDVVIPFEPMWVHLKRIIKPRGAIVLFGSQPFTSALVTSNPKWFKYEDVWDKRSPVGHLNAKIMPLRRHENILVFGSGRILYNPQMRTGEMKRKGGYGHLDKNTVYSSHGRNKPLYINNQYYPTSIMEFPGVIKNTHPTQKPVALLEYLIRTYTNEGETVLDFTFGSCSAGVAALNTKRRFIGIERDATYYALGVQRVQTAIDNLPPMDV